MTTFARLPDQMRIIELAKRLEVSAAELQKRLSSLDIAAPTVLTSITRADIRLVLEDYQSENASGLATPDPDLIEELLGSLGPSPFARINEAAVTGGNEFVEYFRKDSELEEERFQEYRQSDRNDLSVQIDLDAGTGPDEDAPEKDGLVASDDGTPEAVPPDRLPDRMRIFEVGKRLEVPAAELLQRFNRVGVDANSVLKAVGQSEIRLVLEDYRSGEVDDSTPDPSRVDALLASIDVEAEDAPASAEIGKEADHAEVFGQLEEEEPESEPEPVDLGDDPPGDVVEVDLPLTEADAATEQEDEGEVPQVQEQQVPEAASPPVGEDDELEEQPSPDESEDDVSPEPGPLSDDVLQAALVQAGVVEDEPGSDGNITDDPGASPSDAERHNGFFKRWRGGHARTRIIAAGIGILIGTMLLTTAYAVIRPTYAAESEIVITISGLGGQEVQRELQSFAVVASSQTVLAPVAEEFQTSVLEVRKAFVPAIIADSTVLRFTTTGSSPDEALALNEAITASYMAVANDPLDQSQLEFVVDRIDLVTRDMSALDSDLSELEALEAANASTRFRIESEHNLFQAQLADLQGLLVDLRASGAAPPGSVTFVEGQINTTETRLDELLTEAQTLESDDAAVRSRADRLREERSVLRSELADLQELQVEIEFDQVAGNRVAVLAAGHATDDPVGLTPVRAMILGLLVGGALAFGWVVVATQLRKKQ